MKFRALLFSFAAAFSSSAAADQVRFTGQTNADQTLTVDTLNAVASLGQTKFHCPTVVAVNAQILPKSFSPPGDDNPEGSSPTIYERWDASFCGKVVPLLIAFWPATDGGMMFRVGFPFPVASSAP